MMTDYTYLRERCKDPVYREKMSQSMKRAWKEGKFDQLRHPHKTSKERRADLKRRIFDKLGTVCIKCGFSDVRALQMDHINGGGNKENKKYKSGLGYLRRVLNDDSNKYQILCANCNWIKKYENKEL